MPEYIDRAAAAKIICAWCGTCPNPTVEDLLKCDDICPEFAQIPAADVRPVVLCGVCELHGHCYTEDVFAFARIAEGNRFCAVGKVKTNDKQREEGVPHG